MNDPFMVKDAISQITNLVQPIFDEFSFMKWFGHFGKYVTYPTWEELRVSFVVVFKHAGPKTERKFSHNSAGDDRPARVANIFFGRGKLLFANIS